MVNDFAYPLRFSAIIARPSKSLLNQSIVDEPREPNGSLSHFVGMTQIVPFRRSRRIDQEQRRNLSTGMRKLFAPVSDDGFHNLLEALQQRAQ